MKRLRTLSITNPIALAKRNYRSAWGEPFWRNWNIRKQRELSARQRRAVLLHLVPVRLEAPDVLPGEQPSGAEDKQVVH